MEECVEKVWEPWLGCQSLGHRIVLLVERPVGEMQRMQYRACRMSIGAIGPDLCSQETGQASIAPPIPRGM
jgi:hypothetical protein